MKTIRRVLIANRGEIAVRIIRACRELGLETVAVYSDADRQSLHAQMADWASCIGGAAAADSYLRIEKILGAARALQADAIHPGYGFLAENPAFARACQEAGIVFIGPTAAAMETLGDKVSARRTARAAGVPVVPGTIDPVEGFEEAQRLAVGFGYPVMLKAAAGGGGKGLRRVDRAEDFESAWRQAAGEAASSFGDATLFLEKYIVKPRHIEIQVLADHHGNAVHLGERECSIQRRNQKVIEEAPSPFVDEGLRQRMGKAALAVVDKAGYTNAGTLEFLVDRDRNFFFLEMNTRLQVEHPVTECVTGLDLVKLQICVAGGEPLPLRQSDIEMRGHAIECRIYAEDPDEDFRPSPGRILWLREPGGPGIRIDSGIANGGEVSIHYDPLIAKLIAFGATRAEAIQRLQRALDEYRIAGVKTTLPFFGRVVRERRFLQGDLDTGYVEDTGTARPIAVNEQLAPLAAVLAALAHSGPAGSAASRGSAAARWRGTARWRPL
ncbi:MAG: acetyl-CoA carboxylase biotin carboxylase subunit [Acidobacteriota bacterium]